VLAAGDVQGVPVPKLIDVTELCLRDAHQSLLATRMAMEDMVPACADLDKAGYWSVECWGGATFDACIRFLNEDPWERLRTFRKLMPKSRLQMLLRGQNLLGYRHYEDGVVERFIDKAAENGMDVFRVFDALNDVRNVRTALKAVHKTAGERNHLHGYSLDILANFFRKNNDFAKFVNPANENERTDWLLFSLISFASLMCVGNCAPGTA